jgi:hypothetical protein
LPRIICKIEKIERKNHNRYKEEIPENIIPDFDNMLGSKVSSDKHTYSEGYGVSQVVYSSEKNTKSCSYKPKECEHTGDSL